MLPYAALLFGAAFLLFQVQPMLSKYLLPWYGGAPAVWSAALVFFQGALLGGYYYADRLARCSARRQRRVHGSLIGLSWLLLGAQIWRWHVPLLPAAAWQPTSASLALGRVLATFALAVGLPYFVVSATSPLLQAWRGTHAAPASAAPYRLYAFSNAGSLLGLLSYPFVMQPTSALPAQAWLWGGGYVMVTGGLLALMRGNVASVATPATRAPFSPRWGQRLAWMGWPACASVLLVAMTSHLTYEIAAMPFVWAIPLSAYLLSFIAAFSQRVPYQRESYTVAFFVATMLFCWLYYYRPPTLGLGWHIALYTGILWLGCMICHGELAQRAPAPCHLTAFYVWSALGSALGSLCVTLLAPMLWIGFWELLWGMIACWLALQLVYWQTAARARPRWRTMVTDALVMGGLGMLGVTLALSMVQSKQALIYAARNFYGVVRVKATTRGPEAAPVYEVSHGATVHGFQYQAPADRARPTAYYTANSGAGLAILHHPRRAQGLHIGGIGMGIGTLAAYGRAEDRVRFYEINPAMIDVARGADSPFSFVEDSPATVTIIPGDARLALERELAQGEAQAFDVLVVDAFIDGAIPAHLLTDEAMGVYGAHLHPQGVMAFHISNLWLDLRPVIRRIAAHHGLHVASIHAPGDGAAAMRSDWMVVTRDAALFDQPVWRAARTPLPPLAPGRMWTDAYHSVLPVFQTTARFP